MLALMSETWRGWHEEKMSIRTTKTNRPAIFFISISFRLPLLFQLSCQCSPETLTSGSSAPLFNSRIIIASKEIKRMSNRYMADLYAKAFYQFLKLSYDAILIRAASLRKGNLIEEFSAKTGCGCGL
jgi:hypothetical protein